MLSIIFFLWWKKLYFFTNKPVNNLFQMGLFLVRWFLHKALKMLESWLIASKDYFANIDLVVCSFANCELRSMVLVDRRSVSCPYVSSMAYASMCSSHDGFANNLHAGVLEKFNAAVCLGQIPPVTTTLERLQPDLIFLAMLHLE